MLFDEILNTFENEDIKEFAERCINSAPAYWWKVSASSSGRYHSKISRGDGGLVRHTAALVRILNYILEVESIGTQFTPRERDIMRLSGLVHDMMKSGTQEEYETNPRTKFTHPLKAAEFVSSIKPCTLDNDELNLACGIIKSHMGQFCTNKREPDVILPKPKNKYEILVHLCDYLVSRSDVELEFSKEFFPKPELPDINEWKFTWGKHNGMTIPEIAVEDPGYIVWAKANMDKEPAKSLLKSFEL